MSHKPTGIALALAATAMLATPALAQGAPSSPAATEQAPIDPARLATARQIVARQLPAGAFKQMMGGSMKKMIEQMSGSASQLSIAEIAQIGGANAADVAKLGPGKLGDILAIIDPAFDERMKRTSGVMLDGMGDVLSDMEPSFREAFARAYARRFDAAQLDDINAFFGSPTGRIYAVNVLTLNGDPDVLAAMQPMMSKIMGALPAITQKAQAATADLPKQRSYQDLSPADRGRLANLLGVSEKQLAAQSNTGGSGE